MTTVPRFLLCLLCTDGRTERYELCKAQWSLYVPYSGHYMCRQFNIKQFYVLPTPCIFVFCVDLNGFHNRNGECFLRGTDWAFNCNSGLLQYSQC